MNGVYINLERRADRRVHMQENILSCPFFSNVQRFEALASPIYGLGCALSHVAALKQLLVDFPHDLQYLVMEDDFAFLPGKEYVLPDFATGFGAIAGCNGWDLITLTPYTPYGMTCTDEGMAAFTTHGFHRVNNCQTATAYIIKAAFVPSLIATFETSVADLAAGMLYSACATDQRWKPLQETSVFLYFRPFFARQMDGWSDNEHAELTFINVFENVYKRI